MSEERKFNGPVTRKELSQLKAEVEDLTKRVNSTLWRYRERQNEFMNRHKRCYADLEDELVTLAKSVSGVIEAFFDKSKPVDGMDLRIPVSMWMPLKGVKKNCDRIVEEKERR